MSVKMMKLKEREMKERGITIVALVVTIVVLIILATISINALFSDNGIIQKAKETKEMQANSVIEQETEMDKLVAEYANAMADPPDPFEEAKKDSMLAKTENTKLELITGTVWIPAGFKIHEDSAETIDEGIVITDAKRNEFVWVPVSEESFAEMFYTGTVALSGSTNVTTNYYSNLSINAKDGYVEAPVTDGAYSLTVSSSIFYTNREPDLITDCDEDETNKYYTQAGYSSAQAMAQGFVDDYEAMRNSIQTYKGFYIGRYELTGTLESPTVQSGEVLTEATAGPGGTAGNWYYLYKACRNIVTENNHVTTTMIWGCQWAETMNWLKNTKFKGDEEKVDTDSSSWGNYTDYNTANRYEVGDEKYIAGAGVKQITGYSDYWSANKIYDLSGNCADFSQEAFALGYRVLFGANYNDDGSLYGASDRSTTYFYDQAPDGSYFTARATLYIK